MFRSKTSTWKASRHCQRADAVNQGKRHCGRVLSSSLPSHPSQLCVLGELRPALPCPCPAAPLLPCGPGTALLVLSSPGWGRSNGHPKSWALLLSPSKKEMLLTQTAFQHYLQECCHSTCFPCPPRHGALRGPQTSPCLWWAASSAAAAPSTDRPLPKAH